LDPLLPEARRDAPARMDPHPARRRAAPPPRPRTISFWGRGPSRASCGPSPARSAPARIDQLDSEVATVEPAIPGQKRFGLERGVSADQEVGNDPAATVRPGAPALTPTASGLGGGVGRDRIEADPEQAERVLELFVTREVRPHLGPDDLTGDQSPAVVRGAQRLARPRSEPGIGPEDIEEDRGINGGPHRLVVRVRRTRGATGRGPRISSSRTSTGLVSRRRPKT